MSTLKAFAHGLVMLGILALLGWLTDTEITGLAFSICLGFAALARTYDRVQA